MTIDRPKRSTTKYTLADPPTPFPPLRRQAPPQPKKSSKKQKTVNPGSCSEPMDVSIKPVKGRSKKPRIKTAGKKPGRLSKLKKLATPADPDDEEGYLSIESIDDEAEEEALALERNVELVPLVRVKKVAASKGEDVDLVRETEDCRFSGDPVSDARSKWPHRYKTQKADTYESSVMQSDGSYANQLFYQAKCHFNTALIDGIEYKLNDCVFAEAGENEDDYVGIILEMFRNLKDEPYIFVQWFYRAKDTVIKDQDAGIEETRLFKSDVKDDNPLTCIIRKAKVAELSMVINKEERDEIMKSHDFYADMKYSFPHAFTRLLKASDSTKSSCIDGAEGNSCKKSSIKSHKSLTLLDLYSGCGAMSSGLSLGGVLGGVDIETKWAVDFNEHACKSYEFNHPDTKVRHIGADDFLILLKLWLKMCTEYGFLGLDTAVVEPEPGPVEMEEDEVVEEEPMADGEFEVEKILDMWHGAFNKGEKPRLYYKVCWVGYGPEHDTWEPADDVKCDRLLKEFVADGYNKKLFPLPGDVDFLCGGPPCQGISGLNRNRDSQGPLNDDRNRQLVVYMDIIKLLRPGFVLMENVTDILKFAGAQLASHAVGRLVGMNYQARLGIMAAGAYGVPQCRMRFFLWGALPTEVLPHFALPTHTVLKKGVVTNEYKDLIVGHGEETADLLAAVTLDKALKDMPDVTNFTEKDEMPFQSKGGDYASFYQSCIRLPRKYIFGDSNVDRHNVDDTKKLYDHRPLKLNKNDFERVEGIPHAKDANFRSLRGLVVGSDNVVQLDPTMDRPLCRDSVKFLVPNYALKFESGRSTKPFRRLWTDEIVGTVVGRAEPHNQAILHWSQNRVLTIRENARLQGFPDCYRLFGPVKQRYVQIGNAVSFSVSIPLGYCLSRAIKGEEVDKPHTLPFIFPDCLEDLKEARKKLMSGDHASTSSS